MATRVKLRLSDRGKATTRQQIMDVAFTKLQVPFTRLFDMKDGYKAVCRNSEDADVLLSREGVSEMEKIGVQVIMPPEIKAQRTVFIRQLDYEFGKHSAVEMKENIENYNDWIKIDEIIKIKDYTHVVKIRFADTAITDRVLTNGFLAFNMSVIADQITREKFINLLTCFNCYEYETHTTNNCPHKNVQICSECAQTGHTFRECKEDTKACINCKKENNPNYNTHRTLAMACPLKKKQIKDKEDEEVKIKEDNKNTTYANIARRAVAEAKQPQTATKIVLGDTKDYKVLVSILYAHVMNLACPGSFDTEMNKMLKLNGLEEMKFPDNPPSAQLLKATTSSTSEVDISQIYGATTHEREETVKEIEMEDESESDEGSIEVDEPHSKIQPRTHIEVQVDPLASTQAEGAVRKTKVTKTQEEEMKLPTHFDDIGLTVYCTSESRKYIKAYGDILDGLKSHQLKWTYTNSDYKPEVVEHILCSSILKYHNRNFKMMDPGTFDKINNGLLLERRSPPAMSTQKKKHKKT